MVAVCEKYNFLKKLLGMGHCGIKVYRPEPCMGFQPAATFVNYECNIKITE